MAVLWEKIADGSKYEIRSAGKYTRVYIDNVLHSQINVEEPFAGDIWDLLVLPVFYLEEKPRSLVIGIGGGTAINFLNTFIDSESVKGVDYSKTTLQITRKLIPSLKKNVKLYCEDGKKWLEEYEGEPFHFILEDAFKGEDGYPERALKANKKWLQTLERNLTEDGILVMNFSDTDDVKTATMDFIKKKFPSVFLLKSKRASNSILVMSKKSIRRKSLKRVLIKKGIPFKKLQYNKYNIQ